MSHHHPSDRRPGPHELGQNNLVDISVVRRIVRLADATSGPLVEWGTGAGAITLALAELGRPLEGVELDARLATSLQRRTGPHVCIGVGDILRHAPPRGSTVVSNIPFHITTPVLRHLLRGDGWVHAIVITQWEVARKRAGVGGGTQLTAQWWPWVDVRLDRAGLGRRRAADLCVALGHGPRSLPRDLSADQWAEAWRATRHPSAARGA